MALFGYKIFLDKKERTHRQNNNNTTSHSNKQILKQLEKSKK